MMLKHFYLSTAHIPLILGVKNTPFHGAIFKFNEKYRFNGKKPSNLIFHRTLTVVLNFE